MLPSDNISIVLAEENDAQRDLSNSCYDPQVAGGNFSIQTYAKL